MLLVVCLLAGALATISAGAGHSIAPADDRMWIAQAGNGHGDSLPLISGFNVQSVLFHPKRFPRGTSASDARPGFTRYLAFGTVAPTQLPGGTNDPFRSQLAVAKSDNGIDWTEPERATIQDPGGVDVPMILNEPDGFLAVTFESAGVFGNQFRIHYRILNGNPTLISSIHTAVSQDAVTWTSDAPITQGNPPLLKAATFKEHTNGPTQVFFQPERPSFNPACVPADPWVCRWVMLYHASDGQKDYVAIASSNNGTSFQGFLSEGTEVPLLAPGPDGTWDDGAATLGKLRLRQNPSEPSSRLFDLYYVGGRAGSSCGGGTLGCWSFGTATSEDGLVFTKTSANPVTPRGLLEGFGQGQDVTLIHPAVVDDAGQDGNGDIHARLLYTRLAEGTDGGLVRDAFLAFAEPPPGQAPQIRIASPVGPFQNTSRPRVEVYVTDTLGSSPDVTGVDLRTLDLSVDSVSLSGGWRFETPHLVGALKQPSHKIVVPFGVLSLPDGLRVFQVRVNDLEGRSGLATSAFVVDTTPPETRITESPDGQRSMCTTTTPQQIGCQVGSVGTFRGESIEGSDTSGTAIRGIDVVVTNPLGETRTYLVNERIVEKVEGSEKEWAWRWFGPSPDLHFLLPGTYTFRFLAVDEAGNREKSDDDNTLTLIVT